MNFSSLQAMQQENLSRGSLLVTVNTLLPNRPIPGASISISYTGDPDSVIEEVTTDSSGQSPVIELPAPPLEYSLSPSENQPYAEYNIEIRAEGYEPVSISGTELLPDVTAIQPVLMTASKEESPDRIVIPAHTLFGDYPPKIPEAEVKPMEETGEIVLSRVVVPEYVVVHDGSPDDSTASNYFVRYRDYIKNVACSEIYATWPAETLRANILAIMSFTLNRVFTEWYRGKGYDFTITNSTAYDQSFVMGRTIFESISQVVDDIFTTYITREGISQPLFAQYCDGRRVQCNGLSQWGSQALAEQGLDAVSILRRYYGSDIYLTTAEKVEGVPMSFNGQVLSLGSQGEDVRTIQSQLNAISNNFPAIGKLRVDGVYGPATRQAVLAVQQMAGLPQDGVVGEQTWQALYRLYAGIADTMTEYTNVIPEQYRPQLAESDATSLTQYPGRPLTLGSTDA